MGGALTTSLTVECHETVVILDGGPDAAIAQGDSWPVVAGPESILIAGRIAADSPTIVRIGEEGRKSDFVLAYQGRLATPRRELRLVSAELGNVLGMVEVPDEVTELQIFLTDLDEPDEIYVELSPQPPRQYA